MIRTPAITLLAAMQLAAADPAGERMATEGVEEFQKAYQTWSAEGFANAAWRFAQATKLKPASPELHYWLGAARFHRMLQLRSQDPPQEKQAHDALDQAIDALETAVKLDPRHSESHALLATLYGMRIDGSFLRGMRYGQSVQDHQKLALAHGPENPRVKYLLGAGQFHTADGSADLRTALATLLEAEKLFAKEAARHPADPTAPRWGASSCLTFIGRTYQKLGESENAAIYYHKALALHPSDHIARRELEALTKH